MKIIINNKVFNQNDLMQWRQKRTNIVAKNLGIELAKTDNPKEREEALLVAKQGLSYQSILNKLSWKLKLSELGMNLVAKLSKGPRKRAITTIYFEGISAQEFSQKIDGLMLEDTEEHKLANLAACPDHYVLSSSGGQLEVIETTGNNPLPTQFFITFDEEEAIDEERDFSYPYQSVGIAKLKNGRILGGVRHQFKDTDYGVEARLMVEFPNLCPNVIVKEHQKHLAAEWSYWIDWAIKHS